MTEPGFMLPGDSKDSPNGETGLGGKKSAATRMVTRLRNPDSKLSQMKNQQVAAAVHEANKGFREGKEVPGNRGYKYFGAARDLPGVRELFESDAPKEARLQIDSLEVILFHTAGEEDQS